jgi:soluble lytic murein transglycosylase
MKSRIQNQTQNRKKKTPAFSRSLALICFCLGTGIILFPVWGSAEIYLHIDEQGVYHFTDSPQSADYIPAVYFHSPGKDTAIVSRYEGLIKNISKAHGVRPELVQAIIRVESGFNPKAVSLKGARGLMQLMPVHVKNYNVSNPFDPRQNITAGTKYLSLLLKRYNGDLTLSLAAYNAGPGAVDHYQGIPPYPETKKYVQKVLSSYRQYRSIQK